MRWIIVLFLLLPGVSFGNEIVVPSEWENQSGSVLYIDTVNPDGGFTGRYVNGATGYRCQGIEYAVEGRMFEPLITLNVVWSAEAETCHSITSWTGVIDGDVIETEWSLVRWGDDGLTRFSGASRFERRNE